MIRERKDIDPKYKWDLSVIYADEAAFFADYKKAEELVKEFPKYEKLVTASASGLYETLVASCAIEDIIGRLWEYASLNFAVDTANNQYQALNARVRNLAISAGSASWFVEPYILRLKKATLDGWFREEPRLETFRRTVDLIMQRKAYTLSDECEMLMSKMRNAFGGANEVRSLFANADLKFGKIKGEDGKMVELTDTNYVPFLMSGDRRVRQAAFRTL